MQSTGEMLAMSLPQAEAAGLRDRLAAGERVRLRVHAWDRAGNRIEQTIERAYALAG